MLRSRRIRPNSIFASHSRQTNSHEARCLYSGCDGPTGSVSAKERLSLCANGCGGRPRVKCEIRHELESLANGVQVQADTTGPGGERPIAASKLELSQPPLYSILLHVGTATILSILFATAATVLFLPAAWVIGILPPAQHNTRHHRRQAVTHRPTQQVKPPRVIGLFGEASLSEVVGSWAFSLRFTRRGEAAERKLQEKVGGALGRTKSAKVAPTVSARGDDSQPVRTTSQVRRGSTTASNIAERLSNLEGIAHKQANEELGELRIRSCPVHCAGQKLSRLAPCGSRSSPCHSSHLDDGPRIGGRFPQASDLEAARSAHV